MSYPVTKSLYCSTSSFVGTTFGNLSEGVAPPLTNTTWGWNVGTNTPPNYCEMNRGIEVSRTSTQWKAAPTQSIPNQSAGGSGAGNCWIAGPFYGEFTPGIWNTKMVVKAVTNAATHTGRFLYRIWTSPTGSGENAALVTTSFISSSIVTVNSTTVPTLSSASFSLPQINLKNEYILFQTYWDIRTAAGNNSADNDFVLGTGSLIQTSPFVTSKTRFITQINDDF